MRDKKCYAISVKDVYSRTFAVREESLEKALDVVNSLLKEGYIDTAEQDFSHTEVTTSERFPNALLPEGEEIFF